MRRRTQRGTTLTVVLATIVAAAVLLAVPGLAHVDEPGPLAGIDFIDAWTNDDGSIDAGDTGDDGVETPAYDAWLIGSSSDPSEPGIPADRADKDVAICTAVVRPGDPDFVDVTIDNGYPQYVCTFTLVLTNGSPLPAEVLPSVVDADEHLVVLIDGDPLPTSLSPGQQAEVSYSVRILNSAPQDAQLAFSITTEFRNPPCDDSTIFGTERYTGDLYEIDLIGMQAYFLSTTGPFTPDDINQPNGAAYDAVNGRLYYSARGVEGSTPSDLFFNDLTTGETLAGDLTAFDVGASFWDGSYWYIANGTDDMHQVTLAANGTLVADTLPLADFTGTSKIYRFGDIAITPEGLAYGSTNASSGSTAELFTVDLTSGTYVKICGTETSGCMHSLQLALGSNGTLYAHSAGSGEFWVVDKTTGLGTSIGFTTGSQHPFTDLASGICVEPEPFTASIAYSLGPHGDGTEIGWLGDGELVLMDPDGGLENVLYDDAWPTGINDFGDEQPAWSPDGSAIVDTRRYSSGYPYDLYVRSADGTYLHTITSGLGATHPAWSPDGTLVAFQASLVHSGSVEGSEIYVVPAAGGGSSLLTDHGQQPDWSPDGSTIVFVSKELSPDFRERIWIMNANGSGKALINGSPYTEAGPAWSPDGTRIAFHRRLDNDHTEIFVMDADGTNAVQVTSFTSGHNQWPTWSPDGTRIAFERLGSGIWAVDTDGTDLAFLRVGSRPAWQPAP